MMRKLGKIQSPMQGMFNVSSSVANRKMVQFLNGGRIILAAYTKDTKTRPEAHIITPLKIIQFSFC